MKKTSKKKLIVQVGQASSAGVKEVNQDFHGFVCPNEPQLSSKGVALALADGISSSRVSQFASQAAVTGFLQDYYCTSDAWSVKRSGEQVLRAVNSWLCAQTRSSPQRFERDKGYITTFSGMVIKSNTAHLFHVGDSRIYRLSGGELEPLTQDHRRLVSADTSYLVRALGIDDTLELDYKSLVVSPGDIFVLCTDGIYEFLQSSEIASSIKKGIDDLGAVADGLLQRALENGSSDNLTLQIAQVVQLPDHLLHEVAGQVETLSPPPPLSVRKPFDGFDVVRELQISSRSHVFLAVDQDTGEKVVIKTPSRENREDEVFLERFMMEEWIARRIDNPHVLKAYEMPRPRNYLYQTTEFVRGISLDQWMQDHPKADLEMVRDIVDQVAKGLLAFHRQEMLHQDLRPKNIMIDENGTVKIIDFGAVRVAGLRERFGEKQYQTIEGTAQYSAPEYYVGALAGPAADQFSLAVITYEMLTGELPYGNRISRVHERHSLQKIPYRPVREIRPDLPLWLDEVLKKALHINPDRRFGEVSEFVWQLRNPDGGFSGHRRLPLIERNPVLFWQCVSAVLLLALVLQSLFYRS